MKFIIAEIVLIAALVVSLLSGNGTGAVWNTGNFIRRCKILPGKISF